MGAGQTKHSEKELCFQLHSAIQDGNEDQAKELLLCGAVNPNSKTFIQNRELEPPLISAVENNLHGLVKLLISNNAPVNILDTKKRTPLHIAVILNLLEVCQTLIDNDADISANNIHGDSPLHLAATYNLDNMALLLLRYGADINRRGYEERCPLHSASCQPGNLNVMRILLDSGADPNLFDKDRRTPLHHVAQLGNTQGVDLLLTYSVNIDEVDVYGKTSLHLAVENEELPTARVLIRNGCEINCQDKEGKTPLLTATKKKYEDIVVVLIENGADANIASFTGIVPLRSAVWNKSYNIAQLLIQGGANVNASDSSGVTPLHVACLYAGSEMNQSDTALVELLLLNGANVNARSSKNGRTALHSSTEVENEEVCSLLLRYGADASIQDNKGRTPLSYSTSTVISTLLATSIPEHATNANDNNTNVAGGIPNELIVHLPDRPMNFYTNPSNRNRRRSSEEIPANERTSISDITGSLPNQHQRNTATPSPPPVPERDFTVTPPLVPLTHLQNSNLIPMQDVGLFNPWTPQVWQWNNGITPLIPHSPMTQSKLRDFKWSSNSPEESLDGSLSPRNSKRTKLSRLDMKSLLSFPTYFPTKPGSSKHSQSVCHNVTKATVTKGSLNTDLGCLLDISVGAVSSNVLLYAQSANEYCNSIPRRSNWTQCSNIVHFYTLPSATLRHPNKSNKRKNGAALPKENVRFRKLVSVKFPLRKGATHLLESGEKEIVIMASYDMGRSWEDMPTVIEEVMVENSRSKKSSQNGHKRKSCIHKETSTSIKFAVTRTEELVMFVAMCRPIVTVQSVGPDGGKIISSVDNTVSVNLLTGLDRTRDIELETENVDPLVIEQLQGKEFSYLLGSSRIMHLSGLCSHNDTISQPVAIQLPCHIATNGSNSLSNAGAISYRILMQEAQRPNGEIHVVQSVLGPWKDVTDDCTHVQITHKGKRLLATGNSAQHTTNISFHANVTTSRALFMVVALRSFTSSLSRHIVKVPTNILQINRSYQVCFLVHQKSGRESQAIYTISHKRDAEDIRLCYQQKNIYKGQKRLSVPQTVFEQQHIKVRISGGVGFSGKGSSSSSKQIILHSGLLPTDEKFTIESKSCSYSTENEHIGFLEFSDADRGMAGSRLSIIEGVCTRSPLPSDSSVLVLENKNFSNGDSSSKSSKTPSPQPVDIAQEKSMLLASLPLVLPRQEAKTVSSPVNPLRLINDSLLHQVCKNMDEAELKELGFQLGISQERINVALLPLNSVGTLSRQSTCNVEETGVSLLQEWQKTSNPHEDAVSQLCDALKSIGRDNLAHDIKKLCTPFTVEDSGFPIAFQELNMGNAQ